MTEHFELRLTRSRMLAPSVRHMAFARVDGGAFRFVPGQFVQMHIAREGRALRRSYSIASFAGDPANPDGAIEMAVSYVAGGTATALLSELQHGETIEASGPYGRFCLHEDDTNRRYLLIATGTGVTPYRAMLPMLRRLIPARGLEVCLLDGARSPEELLYGEEFMRFAEEVPGFRFFPCFSRAGHASPRADDRMSYVQDVLPELAPDPARDIAYLCGNPNMVDTCFAMLKDAGLPIPNVRREKYISPADPKPRGAVAT